MKTLRVNFNDDWLNIDTHLGVDDEDGDGIFHVKLISNDKNEFLNFTGLDNIYFKLLRQNDKLFYQFNDNLPIETELPLEIDGSLFLNFDSKIPNNNFTFIDGIHKIKIFAE